MTTPNSKLIRACEEWCKLHELCHTLPDSPQLDEMRISATLLADQIGWLRRAITAAVTEANRNLHKGVTP